MFSIGPGLRYLIKDGLYIDVLTEPTDLILICYYCAMVLLNALYNAFSDIVFSEPTNPNGVSGGTSTQGRTTQGR